MRVTATTKFVILNHLVQVEPAVRIAAVAQRALEGVDHADLVGQDQVRRQEAALQQHEHRVGLVEDVDQVAVVLDQVAHQLQLADQLAVDARVDPLGLDLVDQVLRGHGGAQVADHGLDGVQVGGAVALPAAGVAEQGAVAGQPQLAGVDQRGPDDQAALLQCSILDLELLLRAGQAEQRAAGVGLVAAGAVAVPVG